MERNANAYYDLVAATVEAFNERIQYDELTEDSDYHDALHEVVDSNVPHYYSEIFTVMAADGISHEFDDAGLIPDTKDVTRILQARIYEALYNDVQNDTGIVWWEDTEEEEDSEEYWVIKKSNGLVIWQALPLEEAIGHCKEAYEIGAHYVVEDVNDNVVFDPAEDEE